MAPRTRACALLAGLALGHLAAFYAFTRGFLLTRMEMHVYSDCMAPPLGSSWPAAVAAGSCWFPRTYRRLILIIIDAWRYDFALPVGGCNASTISPYVNAPNDTLRCLPGPVGADRFYHGHMPKLARRLREHRNTSVLLRAVADAPTVTMQRLKALTSGSLPTFIDVSDNFASSVIVEDTLIRQARTLGRRLVFMGDDTWVQLFPSRNAFTGVTGAAAGASTSTDGYTVGDSFALAFPYPSFDVRDLHTVDDGVLRHLGPALRGEYGQWDGIVAHFLGVDHVGHRFGPAHDSMPTKLQQMDDAIDSVATQLNDDTLLVVLGDHGMTPDGNHGGATSLETDAAAFVVAPRGVYASDTVETIAQIDLVPLMATALGWPIPFGSLGVLPRLLHYASPEVASACDTASCKMRADAVAAAINAGQIRRYLQSYVRTAAGDRVSLAHVQQLEQLWHSVEQQLGVVRELDVQDGGSPAAQRLAAKSREYARAGAELCRQAWTTFDMPSMVIGIAAAFALVFTQLLLAVWVVPGSQPTPGWSCGLACGVPRGVWQAAPFGAVIVLRLWALFTNSFIVAEHWVVAYLLKAVVLVMMWQARRQGMQVAVAASLILGCSRATELYSGGWLARLHPAFASIFDFDGTIAQTNQAATWPSEAVPNSNYVTWLHTAAPLGLLASASIVRAVKQNGAGYVVRALHCITSTVVAAGLYFYWVTQSRGLHAANDILRLWLPRLIFALAVIRGLVRDDARCVDRWNATLPDAWGSLWSLLAAERIQAVLTIAMLLLGPYSPAVLLLMVVQHASCVVLIQQHAAVARASRDASTMTANVLGASLLVSLSASHFFSATGHASQFSALHYSAAFVGFDGFQFVRSGLLLAMATFAAPLYWHTFVQADAAASSSAPGVTLMLASCMPAATAACAALFACIARRHLMVWAIFAPKYVFEAATLGIVDVSALLAATLAPSLPEWVSPFATRPHHASDVAAEVGAESADSVPSSTPLASAVTFLSSTGNGAAEPKMSVAAPPSSQGCGCTAAVDTPTTGAEATPPGGSKSSRSRIREQDPEGVRDAAAAGRSSASLSADKRIR